VFHLVSTHNLKKFAIGYNEGYGNAIIPYDATLSELGTLTSKF